MFAGRQLNRQRLERPHQASRATGLYDRRGDEISLDGIERFKTLGHGTADPMSESMVGAPHAYPRSTNADAHPKQRLAYTIHGAGRVGIKCRAHNVYGSLIGYKDCGTKPSRLLFDVAINIAAPGTVNRQGERMPKQNMGQFMRNAVALPPVVMEIVVHDDPFATLGAEGRRRECAGVDL